MKWVVDYGYAIGVNCNHKEFDSYEEAVEFGRQIASDTTFKEGDTIYPLHYAKLICEPTVYENEDELYGWNDFVKEEAT